MAFNKKVFTYGSKKEGTDKQWTGVLKGDASKDQQPKRLLKKSVWAKAPGKATHKLNNKEHKCEEVDDPFGFVVDDDNKKTVSPGLEKHKMPSKTLYSSSNNKSRMEGKVLPQHSVTINAKELKLFGSPRKSVMNNDTTEESSKCKVQGSVSTTNDIKKSKIENETKCDDSRDVKTTKKTDSDKNLALKKCSVSPDKLLNIKVGPDKLLNIKASPGKLMNIKAVVSISPNKTKPINIKPVVRVTKLNRDKCKNLEAVKDAVKQLEKERELKAVKPVKPVKQLKGKPQLKCGSIPVQFIDDNTVLVIRQKETKCDDLCNNKKKTKTKKTSNKNSSLKKSSAKEDEQVLEEDDNIFNILSNENHDCSSLGKHEVEKHLLAAGENHLLAADDEVENEDEFKFSDEDEDDDRSENELENNIPFDEDMEMDDDMPLQKLCKSLTKSLDDDLENEDDIPLQKLYEDDIPLQRLCKSPSKSPSKSPIKRSVRRKRSLFSYYDKQDNKTNSVSNDNLKEFDFMSESDEITNIDDHSNESTSLPSTSEHFDDLPAPAPPSKKNKVEDYSQGSLDSFADSQDSFSALEKVQFANAKSKSPFKSKKPSAGFRHFKSERRFSSLPTDITLESEDGEDFSENEVINTPPPLYRSSIFGFRKGSASDHKIRVRRDEKELYTVVRNTKHAHECLEYGQTQQFKDDLDYLLDGLKSTHNVSTRCLSALELASKCTSPEFRMHIKAHGIIDVIFTVLEDAFSEEQLLLCASMIMYVLAQDKLKINFNKKTIGFMLHVITKKRADDDSKSQVGEKMMKKIRNIFEKVEDVDLDIDTLDATILAREALLSLTVKRTGEWFKDEIRELGGLDHLADTVYSCCQCIQKRNNVDQSCVQMKRCLALFSDMSYKSTANQAYLLSCRNSVVMESCVRTLHAITTSLDKEITTLVAECVMSIQLLLMNLSHENENACIKICKQDYGLDSILRSSLHLSRYLPSNMAYENTIVSLCLLINLVAHHPQNKIILNKKVTVGYSGIQSTDKVCLDELLKPVEALMQMFLLHSEACKEADLMQELEKLEREESEQEAKTHYQEDEYALTCGDKFEDTIDEENGENSLTIELKKDVDAPLNETEKRDIKSTLDKAQRHMEDSHLAAYTALLIGLLMEDDVENQELTHSLLPDGDFAILQDSIEKILRFMEMTNPLSKSDQDCMKRIIQVLSNCNEKFKEKG